jgi:ectonucleotide pyrophosphatase/phosphodiesterase family protein 1/3
LEGAGILGCIDLIVLADHGMAPSPPGEKFLIMDDYVPNILNDAKIYDGVFPTIRPKLDTEGERDVLLCDSPIDVFLISQVRKG